MIDKTTRRWCHNLINTFNVICVDGIKSKSMFPVYQFKDLIFTMTSKWLKPFLRGVIKFNVNKHLNQSSMLWVEKGLCKF